MKTQMFSTCMALTLGLAAGLSNVSAQQTPGIEGPWVENITVRNCQTGDIIRTVRELGLFIHDGSYTGAGATVTGLVAARTSSIGTWRHDQAKTYSSVFQFIGLTQNGAFATQVRVTRTIELNGDHWTSQEFVQFMNADGVVVGTACSMGAATRAQ